jgi:hypothetical protein
MHFLQFGRNPFNTLIRVADIQTVSRSLGLREIILRTYAGQMYSEKYQEHEIAAFDARWVSVRNTLVNT